MLFGLLGLGLAVAVEITAPMEPAAPAPRVVLGEATAGRVALVNVWATWCLPCMEELPRLAALHERLDPALATVVALNVDPTEARARAVLKRLGADLPVIYDPGGVLTATLAPPALPTSWLVDRDGQIRAVYAGALDDEALVGVETALRALMAEDAITAAGPDAP